MVIEAESGGETTDYLYGLERIAALNSRSKTEYAYDGRGSVAAELRYTDAWYTLGGALSNAEVTSKSYTPFGEQIGEALSGFAYNGEYYNANTGMVYLRARFYEPEMNRFSQKDIVRGGITVPNSFNRYTYVQNDPLNLIDPSGESLKSAWNSAKTAVKNAWTATKTAVSNAANSVKNWATNTWNKLTNKSSAPAVAPPVPTQQRNTLPAGNQTQKSGNSKNAGKTDYSTASSTQIAAQQYATTSQRSPNNVADFSSKIDDVVATAWSCTVAAARSLFSSLKYPGEIHRQVQLDLAGKYGLTMEKMVGERKKYRLDLYDELTHEYWEIKPESYNSPGTYKYRMLQNQIGKYDQYADRGRPLGSGEITYGKYEIEYYSDTPGLVFYTFRRNDTEPVLVPNAEKEKEKNHSATSLIPAGLVVVGAFIIIITVGEDIVTLGAGLADDIPTISAGFEMIQQGLKGFA